MVLFSATAELYWHLPILVVLISLVYSGTRYDDWGAIINEAVRWGLRMILFLVGIAAVVYAFSQFI